MDLGVSDMARPSVDYAQHRIILYAHSSDSKGMVMIVIIDDYIKDEALLAEIVANLDEIFADPGVYKWWRGWWSTPAKNITQRLIEHVWTNGCPITNTWSISGIEYWTGIQTCSATDEYWNDHLMIHTDKDEELWNATGVIIGPSIGTIYYPPGQDFEGGNLEIFTDGRDTEPEVIKAKSNRLIIFQAGDHLHQVAKVTRGSRKAIAFNLWDSPPSGVLSGSLKEE